MFNATVFQNSITIVHAHDMQQGGFARTLSRQSSSISISRTSWLALWLPPFRHMKKQMIRQPRSIRLMKKTAMRTTVASNTGSIGAGPSSGQSDPQHSPVALIVPSSLHVHVLHLSSHSQLSPISLVRSPAHGVPRVALIAPSSSRQCSITWAKQSADAAHNVVSSSF